MTNISISEQIDAYGGRKQDGSKVCVRYRDKAGNRKTDFYNVPAEAYVDLDDLSKRYDGFKRDAARLEPSEIIEDVGEYLNAEWLQDMLGIQSIEPNASMTVDKNPLARVSFASRSNVKKFMHLYEPVYGADLAQADNCAITYAVGTEEFPLHTCYFDIEALQFKHDDPLKAQWLGPFKRDVWQDQQMINSIVAYDNYTKTYMAFSCHPTWSEEVVTYEDDGRVIIEKKHSNEGDLLASFAEWFVTADFDIITGWNSAGYDLTVLYHRLESHRTPHCMNGVDFGNGLFPTDVYGAGALSPLGIMDSPWFKKNTEYLWQEQPLRGVDSLDMMVAFRRLYKDATNNELVSSKLARVAAFLELRDGKLDSPNFWNKEYHIDWEKFLKYNVRDVELLIQIDEAWNVIGSFKAVQQLVGCQFRSTFYATGLARVMFSKEANWKQRCYPYEYEFDDDDELQGAIVFDPEELNSVGLHDWTVILDFAGLYPSIMCAFNTSHETKVRPGMAHLADDMIGHNNVRFRKNPVGVLPKMVLQLDEQRDEYKAKLQQAEAVGDKLAAKKWNAMQLSVKRMRASFYGIMAFKQFSWHDSDIAKTITAGGRNALLSIKKKTEEEGFKVVFGHTDSIFVTMPKEWTQERVLEESLKLGKTLTAHVQKEVRSDAVVVELEAIMDKYFIAKKNRYAGRKIWDDKKGFLNMDFSEDAWPEVTRKMSGMEAKQTNTAPVGRNIQIQTLARMFSGEDPIYIQGFVTDLVHSIRAGSIEDSQLIANAKLNKWVPHHLDWHWNEVSCSCGRCPLPKTGEDSQDADACYAGRFWSATCAKFHNDKLLSEEHGYDALDKGDSFSWAHVTAGPTAIPAGGWVGFHDLEQISEYTLDYELLAQKHVIDKMENIYVGMGWDFEHLKTKKIRYSSDDFLV